MVLGRYESQKTSWASVTSEMIKFYSPVTEEELFEVSNDCDYGLVALDDKLTTGNIPGKILTYLNFQLHSWDSSTGIRAGRFDT